MEAQVGSVKLGQRVLIVDDLLATGGTLEATAKLVERLGGVVVGYACIIELLGLGGRKLLEKPNVPVLCPIIIEEK